MTTTHDPDRMGAICGTLADSLLVGLEGSPLADEIEAQPVRDPSIHSNGVTLRITIDDQDYVAEFRHVEDEVV